MQNADHGTENLKKTELSVISYGEIWDRLNYYGLQALLILYLTQHYLFTDKTSYLIYGVYTALSFALTISGGFIADKILGFFNCCCIGGFLIAAGNIILSIPSKEFLYIGLATIVTGIGLFKPNNVTLLGSVYSKNITLREKAFSVFYMCVNIGSILGPIIYGMAAEKSIYNFNFIFSATGILSVVIFFLKFKDKLKIENAYLQPKVGVGVISIFGSILVAWALLKIPEFFEVFLFLISIIFTMYFFKWVKTITQEEKILLTSLILPFLCCVLYFSCLLQIYSSLNLFLNRFVDRTLLNWTIPSAWFTSLEPLFIVASVPVLNKLWGILNKLELEPSPQNKINIGLILSAIGFYIFSLLSSSHSNNNVIVLILILLANLFFAVSELCIIPITMSLTNLYAPKGYKGTMIGIFYFTLTLSGYFSGLIARTILNNSRNNPSGATDGFFNIAVGLVSLAGLIILSKFALKLRKKNKYILSSP